MISAPFHSLQSFIWNVRTLGPLTWLRCAIFNVLQTWTGIVVAAVLAYPLVRGGGVLDHWLGMWWLAVPATAVAGIVLFTEPPAWVSRLPKRMMRLGSAHRGHGATSVDHRIET